jgi:SAM-dependent methyltransferase
MERSGRVPDFSSRISRPELLDMGCMPDEEARRTLLDIRRINRIFGGRRLLLDALATEVARYRLARFSVLDIASGSCDLPLAILDWAEQRGLEARVFALEYWHRHLALFRNELSAYPNLHPFCADAFRVPLESASFDFVTCCHFFHHLTDVQAAGFLWSMSRWARCAVIISDLERRPVPYYFFRLFSPFFTTSFMSRNDGLISLRRSFRKEELQRTAERAGLEVCRVERRWPFRLLLVAKRNGASDARSLV